MTSLVPLPVHPAAHRAGVDDPDWTAMARVLVVRPDNVGDVIMTVPALRALRAAAPQARIDLLASPAGAAAAPLVPEVDDVVVASVSWQRLPGPVADEDADPDAELVATLAGRRYDAAVILTSFSQSPWPAALLCRRAGIGIRIGTSKEFGGDALTHWVPAPPDGGHQVDRGLEVLAAVGVPSRGVDLAVTVPITDHPAPAGRYVVVAPGASCPSRRWSPERFATAGRGIAGRGWTVVVTGTAKEADLVARAAAGVPGAVTLVGELDLAGLADLVAGADAAVVNNSGGAHLADAVGTPVVELFAGTEEVGQYAPRTVRAEVLTRPVACSPCRQLVCPFDQECLDIAPERVVDAVVRVARART
ncbi:glycosyltransferase family 9 protein [Actinomycetospora termitidis]|uniref:Glycosyltransferase family 9 protein n=1 Tax=Actinomycetospora termitidis TaxID=3053470 RepID=A0ABT7MAU8_9PSEU|nr:glycosyltransferase family 9 protein [Actinomycetospora sp. Odt1-22]MDL5157786.1 glycosyltransferase family 9 protein [Actinomycetospora sp. Odt1-22]